MMKNKKPDVLVLNRGFIPIHIIEWKKAMSLIIQDTAMPIDEDYISYLFSDWLVYSEMDEHYPKVSTVRYKISLPEIITLRKYDRLPTRDVKYSRQSLFQRDNFKCAYCGKQFDRKELTVDHIVPRAKGGKTHWLNTVSACKGCNYLKADRTLEQSGMKLLIKPKKPNWISPLSGVKRINACKSWLKFMDRI